MKKPVTITATGLIFLKPSSQFINKLRIIYHKHDILSCNGGDLIIVRSYNLNSQDIETMLQEKYGNKIEPVNRLKLEQLKRQQQQRKNASS